MFVIQNQCGLFFPHTLVYVPAISHLDYTIVSFVFHHYPVFTQFDIKNIRVVFFFFFGRTSQLVGS